MSDIIFLKSPYIRSTGQEPLPHPFQQPLSGDSEMAEREGARGLREFAPKLNRDDLFSLPAGTRVTLDGREAIVTADYGLLAVYSTEPPPEPTPLSVPPEVRPDNLSIGGAPLQPERFPGDTVDFAQSAIETAVANADTGSEAVIAGTDASFTSLPGAATEELFNAPETPTYSPINPGGIFAGFTEPPPSAFEI